MPATRDRTTAGNREKELVELAQAGDAPAFEQLYRDHVDRVYALCLRLSADVATAEELTQDVFVRAWERLGSFRGESQLSTWLHRLAVNVALGARRSDGRRRSRIVAVDLSTLDPPGRSPAPGTAIDLERAIASLPEGARRAFVLHDVEGFRHHEIAEQSGLAVGTCKAQLHRARKLLRQALGR